MEVKISKPRTSYMQKRTKKGYYNAYENLEDLNRRPSISSEDNNQSNSKISVYMHLANNTNN
jgi:hypothetical protein